VSEGNFRGQPCAMCPPVDHPWDDVRVPDASASRATAQGISGILLGVCGCAVSCCVVLFTTPSRSSCLRGIRTETALITGPLRVHFHILVAKVQEDRLEAIAVSTEGQTSGLFTCCAGCSAVGVLGLVASVRAVRHTRGTHCVHVVLSWRCNCC
jgi:hypothetical protein